MKHWRLLAIGFGAYALALIATAPATLLDAGLKRASDGRLRIAAARGTLWAGSGQFAIRDPDGRTGIAKDLVWRVLPVSLLRGRLLYEVKLEQTQRRFPVTISPARIELQDASLNVPASVLGLGVPRLAPLGLTGIVQIHVSSLSIAHGGMEGKATVQWRAAGSSLTPVSPLGDYEVSLNGKDQTISILLRTLAGPLLLDGSGSWTRGGAPAFLATARVPPQHQQQLAPLLRLIAVERGAGRFEAQFN